ncbi:MAG: hypothetical protein AAFX78_02105 [Cyanobacteria bacterium J06638_20]
MKRILNDIKRGENLDLYLTIPAAVLVGVLNLLGIVSPALVAPLTLIVLGFITITILGSRYRVEQLADKLMPSVQTIFSEKSPSNLDQDIENALDVWLIGILHSKHARDWYSVIEKKLQKGHSVRILTVHPDPVILEFTEMRVYGFGNVKIKCSDIEAGLETFCSLKKLSPNNLLIRTIHYPLARGFVGINPDAASGSLYIRTYSFKTPGGAQPKFTLRAKDGYWYDFFKQEIQNLWDAGNEWPCP